MKMIIAIIQLLFIAALLLVGQAAALGGYYYFGVLLAAALSIYQQYLIRIREPKYFFQTFLNNNWLGAAVFSGLVLHYLVH